jgi:phenylalanyl-tRNA synthetase alpha chain
MPALTSTELAAALAVRDLTDPTQGPHALQLLVTAILDALAGDVRLVRAYPVVPVEENYDQLGYAPDAITRDARYTRYAGDGTMLRSHTSAMIPPALRRLAAEPGWCDVTLACPGIVHRRDAIDRLHTGTPHQLDLWRVVAEQPMTGADLDALIAAVLGAALPGTAHRTAASPHPYTEAGRQIDVLAGDEWVEVGECGLAAGHVLAGAGLGPAVTGLAMGLGLDRLLMLRKGIPDIRLLRATDPRIAGQLLDLAPYRPVSSHPPVTRDLSLAVPAGTDAETIGDRVRQVPGAEAVEQLSVLAETPVDALPPAAVHRLGARSGQVNLLLRVVLRHPERTLTDADANALRDRIYAALHEGAAHEWAVG